MRDRFIVRQLLLIAVLAAAGSQLAGCGQKGPLYMPDEPQDTEASQEQAD